MSSSSCNTHRSSSHRTTTTSTRSQTLPMTNIPYASPVSADDHSAGLESHFKPSGSDSPPSQAYQSISSDNTDEILITSIPTKHFCNNFDSLKQWDAITTGSTLKNGDLVHICSLLGNPKDFLVQSIPSSMRPNFLNHPTMAFWQSQIDAGLRFPLCPYLIDLCKVLGIPINQIGASSLRPTLFFFILLKHFRRKPSAELFYTCFDFKRSGKFYYFASRTSGPVKFMSRLPSVDGKWKDRYFAVTPSSGKWPFSHKSWFHGSPSSHARPAISSIPSRDKKVIDLLNNLVTRQGPFKIVDLLRDPRVLAHFSLFTPEKALPPITDMDISSFAILTDDDDADFSSTPLVRAPNSKDSANPPIDDRNTIVVNPTPVSTIIPTGSPSVKRKLKVESTSPPKRSRLSKGSSLKAKTPKNSPEPLVVTLPRSLKNADKDESHMLISSLPTSDDFQDYGNKSLS